MDTRLNSLQTWLTETSDLGAFSLQALPGDASFRRYFRVTHSGGTFIAMDAPPEREDCRPYVAIARALRAQGLLSPEIIKADLKIGFLLITDFGDRQFLKELNHTNAEQLYSTALQALMILKNCSQVEGWSIPLFTADFMFKELLLFQEWFLEKFLQLELSSAQLKMLSCCFSLLAESAAAQPQVFMHRDFHSANLMLLPHNRVGILDFQDAFMGPVTYDLVSLLRDCYIDWPPAVVQRLALNYLSELQFAVSEVEWLRWFDWMGLQRHLKALLTFSRKFKRDANPNYLQFIPRTLSYIERSSQEYSEFKEFHLFLQENVLPAMNKASVCVQ